MAVGEGQVRGHRAQLSAVDAELAAALGPQLGRLTVGVRWLGVGPWDGPPEGDGFGTLVCRGRLACVARLRERRSLMLAWPGDLLVPVGDGPSWLTSSLSWEALEPSVVADLDGAFAAAVARRPEAAPALAARAGAFTARTVGVVAVSHLPRVEDRLLGVLLLLADEHGRMTADGIVVDADVTHERLGQLMGAARPTVSLAFARLRELGLVEARDAEWVIRPDAADALARTGEVRAPGGS